MDGGKVVSGKVCLACRSISKSGGDVNFNGYHIFLLNLSQLLVEDGDGDLQLQPTILLDFPDYCMAVYGLDSKLYFFDNTRCPKSLLISYLDIKDEEEDEIQRLSTADLRTLPPMSGFKRHAMITSIPATKKILVFSSLSDVCLSDPDWVNPPAGQVDDDNDFDADDMRYVDFEIYDWLTNSWEILPPIIIRADFNDSLSMPRYFLHESGYVEAGKRGTEIPRDAFASRQILFQEFQILKYTFVHTESSSSLSLLVELTCGLMLTLDLDAPSKAWKLVYDGMRVALKPPRAQGNFFIIADHIHEMWCLSDIGKQSKLASAEKSPLSSCFPLSSFGEEDPVKSIVGSSLTPLPSLEDDDDKQKQKKQQYFCIVQGAVSRNSKLPRVVMDVVDAQAAPPQSVASCRFGVPTHKCKRFLPYCIFPYHPYP